MNGSFEHYTRLAGLFSYPAPNFAEEVREIQSFLEDTCLEAAEQLTAFTEFAEAASPVDVEEVYTRSFDVQAVTTLDLGYVLFGDDYKRGELMVKLNAEHHEASVDCGTELPDHLPNVLRLLSAMQKSELREELAQKIIAPALHKIIGEFDPDKVKAKNAVYLKNHKTLIETSDPYRIIYRKPLQALYAVMERDFDIDIYAKPPSMQQNCFLKSIGSEIALECNAGECHVRSE